MKKIKDLEVRNIREKKWSDGDIELKFRIQNCQYKMDLIPIESGYLAQGVFHESIYDYVDCPFCEKKVGRCLPLNRHNQELFEHLINQPELRLRWLTKPKVIKTNVESEEN